MIVVLVKFENIIVEYEKLSIGHGQPQQTLTKGGLGNGFVPQCNRVEGKLGTGKNRRK
jgi:hypothetical protein